MGILQARILEWVATPSSRGSSQSKGRARVSCPAGGILYPLSPRVLQGRQDLFAEFCLLSGLIAHVWAPNAGIAHPFWFPDQERWLKCFFLFFPGAWPPTASPSPPGARAPLSLAAGRIRCLNVLRNSERWARREQARKAREEPGKPTGRTPNPPYEDAFPVVT